MCHCHFALSPIIIFQFFKKLKIGKLSLIIQFLIFQNIENWKIESTIFLLAGISLEKLSTKDSPVTAAILIKPECLAHFCIEHVFLYLWVCCTSWLEQKPRQSFFCTFFSIISLKVTFCCVRHM